MMDKERVARILQQAQEIFFEALLAGYTGDGSLVRKEVSDDGYKTLTFPASGGSINGFRVIDRYCVHRESNKSCGTTTVFFEDQPVWWMSYRGEYFEEAIPFLKEALSQAYSEHKFCCGRGPSEYSSGPYNYTNNFGMEITFVEFYGTERITRKDGSVMGYHCYNGMALI